MPTLPDVLQRLREHRDELRRMGALRLAVFGSVARGEAGPDSDLDLLVELDRRTFDRYMDLKLYLETSSGSRWTWSSPTASSRPCGTGSSASRSMPREVRVYLEDLLEALDRIQRYTEGLDRGTLGSDSLILDAVLHNLQIVGEAAKRTPAELRQLQPDTEWRKIAGMLDLIVHAYFDIDPDIVWDVVATKIAPLRSAVQELLRTLDS